MSLIGRLKISSTSVIEPRDSISNRKAMGMEYKDADVDMNLPLLASCDRKGAMGEAIRRYAQACNYHV